MKKILVRAGLILLLILLIVVVCWRSSDRLLNNLARPQIETFAANLLGAKVQIGQLNRTENGLEILDLQISSRQTITFVPHIALNFTFASLWDRQFKELLISNPQLEITPSTEDGIPEKAPFRFPEQIPINIDRLLITNGRVDINRSPVPLRFHQLNFTGTLKPLSEFTLSTFVGSDNQQPVAIKGSLQYSPAPNLTLDGFSWQGQQLLTAPLSMAVNGGELALEDSQITLPHFDDHQLISVIKALGQSDPLPPELAFSLTNSRIGIATSQGSLRVDLHVPQGQLSWNRFSSSVSALQVSFEQAPKGWKLSGEFTGPAQTSFLFSARVDDANNLTGQALIKIPDPGKVKEALIGGSGIKIKGALNLAVDFSLTGQQLEMKMNFQGENATHPLPDYLIDISRLNGQGTLLVANAQETFTLVLRQESQPLGSASGNFQNFKASLTAENQDVLTQLLNPDLIPQQLQSVSGGKVEGQFSGTEANWSGRLKLSANEILLSGLSLKNLAGQAKLQTKNKSTTFDEVSIVAEATYGDGLTSHLAAQAGGEFSDTGYALAIENLSATDLNYNSVDGLSGIGAAAAALQGRINGRWQAESIELDLKGTLAAKEVLDGVFYANLSSYPANFSLRGNLNIGTRNLTAEDLEIYLPNIGKLAASGQFGPDRINSVGHFDLVELNTSYREHLKPLFREIQPMLAELDLAGLLTLDYQLLWEPAGWQTHGGVTLQALTAHWRHLQLEMRDGHGTIPFFLGSGTPSNRADPVGPFSGDIAIGALSVGSAALEQAQLKLSANLNRLDIPSRLELKLAGGKLSIKDIRLGLANGQLQGSVNIDIAGVGLESLTRDLNLPVMQGNLSAKLGTIRYLDRQLSTDGIASLELFGGRFQFGNLRYSDPFSRHPIFSTDIDFKGLDLQQTTRTFDFGEMNGILDGQVRGLQLFGTTPAAFEASVATREEGTRNISVKALNNLSILSQGGISAALSRGIYQFIDFYRYREIAFDCSLVNDTFTLIGTALPDSNRYLVYGGLLPPRIDITTTTPTISFKEMVKRLGRIDRAGSRTNGGKR